MAKGQMRGNREKKKPKQDKPKVIQANAPFAAALSKPPSQASAKKK